MYLVLHVKNDKNTVLVQVQAKYCDCRKIIENKMIVLFCIAF